MFLREMDLSLLSTGHVDHGPRERVLQQGAGGDLQAVGDQEDEDLVIPSPDQLSRGEIQSDNHQLHEDDVGQHDDAGLGGVVTILNDVIQHARACKHERNAVLPNIYGRPKIAIFRYPATENALWRDLCTVSICSVSGRVQTSRGEYEGSSRN